MFLLSVFVYSRELETMIPFLGNVLTAQAFHIPKKYYARGLLYFWSSSTCFRVSPTTQGNPKEHIRKPSENAPKHFTEMSGIPVHMHAYVAFGLRQIACGFCNPFA